MTLRPMNDFYTSFTPITPKPRLSVRTFRLLSLMILFPQSFLLSHIKVHGKLLNTTAQNLHNRHSATKVATFISSKCIESNYRLPRQGFTSSSTIMSPNECRPLSTPSFTFNSARCYIPANQSLKNDPATALNDSEQLSLARINLETANTTLYLCKMGLENCENALNEAMNQFMLAGEVFVNSGGTMKSEAALDLASDRVAKEQERILEVYVGVLQARVEAKDAKDDFDAAMRASKGQNTVTGR
ncbi:hypothetical protein HYFRA_00013068 [Hymenoscyphus fraxineus]|uniref:Uncharacterized protein n=1 Tax=Hymenoscyphus fraxineus TaxID=746836 RepID=A0A9N9L748_9HELO|nr:hypothetical protein HYFRA_00013068 [Hymenoscyphus fraxineus]